jgi:pimeloyl-ACP methyl ester carboxylesterase
MSITIRSAAVVATTVFAVLAAGCSGGSGSSTNEAGLVGSPSPSPSEPDGAFSGLVDIGGGRHLFAICQGAGKPTIILEAGDESDTYQWGQVMPQLARHTRTCAYDRLGVGQSDPATGCRGPDDLRHDTEALLNALGDKGPYLLVGHSGGGFLMADFAYAHPHAVAGLVLAETPKAIDPKRAGPELLSEINCHSASNQESRDYVAVENFAWRHRHKIGDVPMTVISNRYDQPYPDYEARTNVRDQRDRFALSPQARQVVVTSGHEVQDNQPDLVAKEILGVLRSTRG